MTSLNHHAVFFLWAYVFLLLLLCSAFRVCDHPDESMRQELAEKIGIDAQQVKFWFQNRRTKIKVYLDLIGS